MPKARKHSTSRAVATLVENVNLAVSDADEAEEPRIFPIFDEVPPGCCLFRVGDNRHEPFLRDGDFVVVDTADRQMAVGELHLILQSDGPILWQIKKETRGVKFCGRHRNEVPYILCPLSRTGFHLSDGWLTRAELAKNILGRVIGLLDPRERASRQSDDAVHDAVEWRRAQRARLISGHTKN